MSTPAKILIVLGIIFILIGVFLPWIQKLGLGSLPGDILVRKKNFTFYFPIVTCIIISVIISLIFWLFRK